MPEIAKPENAYRGQLYIDNDDKVYEPMYNLAISLAKRLQNGRLQYLDEIQLYNCSLFRSCLAAVNKTLKSYWAPALTTEDRKWLRQYMCDTVYDHIDYILVNS